MLPMIPEWTLRQGIGVTGFNGMDAPARYGISCAKVEVSSNHLNRQERP
jgi:hypothetical protein